MGQGARETRGRRCRQAETVRNPRWVRPGCARAASGRQPQTGLRDGRQVCKAFRRKTGAISARRKWSGAGAELFSFPRVPRTCVGDSI